MQKLFTLLLISVAICNARALRNDDEMICGKYVDICTSIDTSSIQDTSIFIGYTSRDPEVYSINKEHFDDVVCGERNADYSIQLYANVTVANKIDRRYIFEYFSGSFVIPAHGMPSYTCTPEIQAGESYDIDDYVCLDKNGNDILARGKAMIGKIEEKLVEFDESTAIIEGDVYTRESDMGCKGDPPTVLPTTQVPTQAPTQVPTLPPTQAPTQVPTLPPTHQPPTEEPTDFPTKKPFSPTPMWVWVIIGCGVVVILIMLAIAMKCNRETEETEELIEKPVEA